MPTVSMRYRTFSSMNVLSVFAGTNCPQGGDSGHGGRTVFGFRDECGTDFRIRVDGAPEQRVESLEIILGGDSESDTIIEGLEFALRVLKSQRRMNCVSVEEQKEIF